MKKARKPIYTSPKKLPPQREVFFMNDKTLEPEYVNRYNFTSLLYDLYYKGGAENMYNTGLFAELYNNFPKRMIWIGNFNTDSRNKLYKKYGITSNTGELTEKYYNFKNFDKIQDQQTVGFLCSMEISEDIPTPFDISRAGMLFYIETHEIKPFNAFFRASKINSLLC